MDRCWAFSLGLQLASYIATTVELSCVGDKNACGGLLAKIQLDLCHLMQLSVEGGSATGKQS